ncbi:hypothetical protein PR048_011509 [Dryococelus australis]|uniref:Uncharacterized protein n=1 Tax=Dryococelus australis TaxID=614101 RepID=A0ABQ9HLV7_9NEOP|nr:hypothetical protein PR048_011509 [Dryococelus australis]
MDIVKQGVSLPMQVSEKYAELSWNSHHGELLPGTVMRIIIGPSNCGKKCVFLIFLEELNGLRFDSATYSKSLQKSKYKCLFQILKVVDGVEPHLGSIKNNEVQ